MEASKGFDWGLGLLAAFLDPTPQPEWQVPGIPDPGLLPVSRAGAAQPAKSLCSSQLPAETEPGRPGHRCLGAEKCAVSSLAPSPEKSGEADPTAWCLFPPYLGQLCKSGLPGRAGSREKQSVPSLSSKVHVQRDAARGSIQSALLGPGLMFRPHICVGSRPGASWRNQTYLASAFVP